MLSGLTTQLDEVTTRLEETKVELEETRAALQQEQTNAEYERRIYAEKIKRRDKTAQEFIKMHREIVSLTNSRSKVNTN